MLVGPWMSAAEAAGPYKWPGTSRLAPGNNRSLDRGLKTDKTPHKPVANQEDVEESEGEEGTVKLNYISASWAAVLKDVAEATDSQLIADRIPSGRFSRRDGAEHSRSEAIRIINHEMEANGFRVLEKGKFLVVVDLPSQRTRYSAPIIPKPTDEQGKMEHITPPVRPQRQAVSVTKRPEEPAPSPSLIPAGGTPPAKPKPIALASHEEPEAEAAVKPKPLPAEPMTMVVFRARNQRASELAKRIFRAFRDRAELVDLGRNGLPALRIRQSADAVPAVVQFSIAIDEQREELLIDARQGDSDALLMLLRRLDTPTLDTDGIQLVSTTKTAAQAAAQLPAEIAAMRVARQKAAPMQLAQADAPGNEPPMERPRRPAQALPGQLGDVLGDLKAEVNIEAVGDLGVLILKGNEKDVEQVMKVIRELEKLSELTAPQVHLLNLRNVNSDALAELLTSVFEKLTKFPGKATQPRQSVSIIAVSTPNAILIVAPANDLQSIIELANELDQPTEPDSEFQVFQLQTAIATQMAEILTEMYKEPKGLGARIVVLAEPRTNTLIVRGRPSDLDQVAAAIKKIDDTALSSVSQMRVFVLKNAVAAELAAIINASIQSVLAPPSNQGAAQILGQQGGGGGASQIADQFREVRSTVLELLAIDKDGEKKLKSGILADVRITADPRMNALMVSAPEASLSLIAELIKLLDRPTNQVAEIKVFTLANADAALMVQQLQTLFGISATGAGANQRQGGVQGIQVAGAEDASSGLIPLKFSVDPRTNSVIAIGAAEALRVVEAIMFRLDESDVRQRQTSVYRLKNSPATQIAQAVTQFLTSQRDVAQQDPNLVSNIEQLEREVIVVAEPVSNSLLISATPRYHKDVQELVKKLDEAPKQVVIQALLVEVELQDTDEFGIELGFQDSILFNRSLVDNVTTLTQTTTTGNVQTTNQNVLSTSGTPGYLFGNPTTPLGNNISQNLNPGRVGGQGLNSFSLGRTNNELGFGGLVLSASSESVSFLMRALAANRQVRVLSRPQIRTLDNQLAQIQQGQNVPIVTGVTQTNATTGPQVTRDDAGVILTVIPRISPDSNIVMELVAEKSQYNLTNGVPIFTDTATGNTITSPVKDISTARTTVSVPNGQTIVLGGLITERIDEAHRKVPILGDIPIIGTAFRYDFQQNRRTELLIFLTPRIVYDDATSEHIKDVEMGRLHFDEGLATELHGPLRGVPADDGILTSPMGGPNFVVPTPSPMLPPTTTMPLPATPLLPPTPMVPVPPARPAAPASPEAAESTPLDLTPARDPMITPASAKTWMDDAPTSRVIPAAGSTADFTIVKPQAAGVAKPKVKLGRNNWSGGK